ncbi:hypothetical protein VTN02DRAFT_5442 [Thermoascus thermophilus]
MARVASLMAGFTDLSWKLEHQSPCCRFCTPACWFCCLNHHLQAQFSIPRPCRHRLKFADISGCLAKRQKGYTTPWRSCVAQRGVWSAGAESYIRGRSHEAAGSAAVGTMLKLRDRSMELKPWKKIPGRILLVVLNVFTAVALVYEGYNQGVMGTVSSTPGFIDMARIGADGTVTDSTKQGCVLHTFAPVSVVLAVGSPLM